MEKNNKCSNQVQDPINKIICIFFVYFCSGTNGMKAITDAFKSYHDKTCVKFRPRTSADKGYINFIRGRGCSSYIGNLNRRQDVRNFWITLKSFLNNFFLRP